MRIRSSLVAGLVWLLAVTAGRAQLSNVHIGYVYPAGGQQGVTFEAVVGGQFLTDVEEVYVSGEGVEARLIELIQPISGKELNELRIRVDELMARRAVVRSDFAALERFRSFKNSKDLKDSAADEDKNELDELKKKYAGATWTPQDERLLQEVRKKMGSAVRRPANPAISELAVVEFTVASDAEPGQRELRIVSPSGLSNPVVFCVGQLPEFSERISKEIPQQKSAIAKTSFAPKGRKSEPGIIITLPAVINGQIQPSEVDRYRFTADKGQRLVIAAAGRQLIPYLPDGVPGWFQATLALYDAEGKELAYDDDFRFHPDPVLSYRIPADGEYIVEIKDAIYRGREDFVYRITLGELPFVTSIFPLGGQAGSRTFVSLTGWNLPTSQLTLDNRAQTADMIPLHRQEWISSAMPFAIDVLPECLDKEPNDQQEDAQRIATPVIINGRMDVPGDTDVFSFDGCAGSEIVAEVNARRLNSPLDSLIKLTDAVGNSLAMNDDYEDQADGLTTHHADSYLRATIPADGVYFVHLSDMQHKGGAEYGYRLRISPPRPDFGLRVVPSSISVRMARTVPISVYALRRDGFAGEIALSLKDAPEGCTLSGGVVPASQDRIKLTLTVPPSFRKDVFNLSLEGHATIDKQVVFRPAVPAEDMMQAFEYRHLVPAKELKVAVTGRAMSGAGVSILSEMPIRIPAGGTASVQLGAPSGRNRGNLRLQLSDPPAGIAIQNVSTSVRGAEVVFQSDASEAKPGLRGNLILTASPAVAPSGKGNQRRMPLVTMPAITFEVVEPPK